MCAFTLAEVLITLGIIGVVAALTIPSLTTNYQEKVTVSKLKKNFSILSEAFARTRIENGDVYTWNITESKESVTKVADFIKPYLRILDDCGTEPCEEYSPKITGLNGTQHDYWNFNNDTYYKLRLVDGSMLIILAKNNCISRDSHCGDIYLDINGKKEPNVLGRDIFYFAYYGNSSVKTGGSFGADPKNRDWWSCNPKSEGWDCTAWVLYKENMDYLRCADELTWNGKNKCK